MNKEKIKNWLKDKINLAFLSIVLLSIIVRLYYFVITSSQALWWDEADYLAYAKNLAGLNTHWIIAEKHNSLYPYLAAGIFKTGLGELTIKFFLQLIPSILSLVLVYFICNEMYKDKRIGLIASFFMSVFWVHLFNTTRFHVDIPALFIGLLAIFIFWKGYENKKKLFGKINPNWAIPIAGVLSVLSYTIRRGYFLFGLFFIVYIFSTRPIKELIKDKYNWIGLMLSLVLFFIAEKFIFISQIGSVGQSYFHAESKINFLPLDVFASFFNPSAGLSVVITYLFWLGFLMMLFTIIISFERIRKTPKTKSDLFNILSILTTLAFFIYVLRSPDNFGEPRWYFPLLLGSLVSLSKPIILIYDKIKHYNKQIALIVILLILSLSGYYQLQSSDSLIKSKVESFTGIKEASLLIKEISNENDKIITLGQPQIEYYSERSTIHAREWVEEDPKTIEHFEATIEKIKQTPEAKYLLISFSEPAYPEWMKKIYYDNNGAIVGWEIPFMETKINFATGEQDIKQSRTYNEVTFTLIDIKQEVFIYEIKRE